ncbi:MAG: hypothetical protein IPO47_17060 [Bacteroidetes bacterium]|nr:hypothetical protein [Bacteroidota bacterium]
MRQILFILLTIFLSCQPNQEPKQPIAKTDTTETANSKIALGNNPFIPNQNLDTAKTAIIETFVDSLNIGVKGKCKIELIKHGVYDDIFVVIKFYIKGSNTTKDAEHWMNTNTYSYETTAMMGFEPVVSDYNNDNFNDITFISGTAARGANEVRRLFIYDNQNKNLVSIVNSEDYPNMLYNKKLDCIDAFLVSGGCSTVFLNIKGDSLKMFASVELSDGLTVKTYDKNGNEKIIKEDKTNKAGYIRYQNFNPLIEYDRY